MCYTEIPMNKPQQYTVAITKKIQLTPTVILFTCTLTEPQKMQYTAGQYGAFIIDEKTRRQYSFCSAPGDPMTFEMVIDTAPMGAGSRYFLSRNTGDVLTCMAPLGTFVFDTASHRKKILVATGTGVAPLRSMTLDYLEHEGTDDLTLYWGMRHEEDLYWVGDFQELSLRYPNFRFVVTLSQPSDAWEGKKGRVTSHIVQDEHNLPGSDYYLCGNRNMIADIKKQLADNRVPENQIHTEMYF